MCVLQQGAPVKAVMPEVTLNRTVSIKLVLTGDSAMLLSKP
jgi:hypothetical protein